MLLLIVLSICGETLSDNVIEVDDILSADFMPANLLVLENPQQRTNNYKNASLDDVQEARNKASFDGSVDAALSTMGYHR